MAYNVDMIGQTLVKVAGSKERALLLVAEARRLSGSPLGRMHVAQFDALTAWLTPCDPQCDGDRFICERCENVGAALRYLRGLEAVELAEELEQAEKAEIAAGQLLELMGDMVQAMNALDEMDAVARRSGKPEHMASNAMVRNALKALDPFARDQGPQLSNPVDGLCRRTPGCQNPAVTVVRREVDVATCLHCEQADQARQCPNPWHQSAPARARVRCPECPSASGPRNQVIGGREYEWSTAEDETDTDMDSFRYKSESERDNW